MSATGEAIDPARARREQRRVALLFAALVITLAFLVYGANGAVLRVVVMAGVGVVIAVQTRAR